VLCLVSFSTKFVRDAADMTQASQGVGDAPNALEAITALEALGNTVTKGQHYLRWCQEVPSTSWFKNGR
jgi:hypothetical protein